MTASLFLRNEAGRTGVPTRKSFEAWISAIPELRRRKVEVNILIVDVEAGRRFNRQYRHKDYATNVLSFPWEPAPGERSRLLGDLVICAPVVAREAAEQGKRPRAHWAHLTIASCTCSATTMKRPPRRGAWKPWKFASWPHWVSGIPTNDRIR